MAHPSGHGYPVTGEDFDEVPPDYEEDTLPRPTRNHRSDDREFYGNGGSPDNNNLYYQTHEPDLNGYHGLPRGSGDFDNQTFFPASFEQNGRVSPPGMTEDRGRFTDPSRGAEQGWNDVAAMENGHHHHHQQQQHRRLGSADVIYVNRGFTDDDNVDGTMTLRRRYLPKRTKSSRRRRRASDDAIIPLEDLQRARDFLATLRVKRPTRRKSIKRSSSRRDDEDGEAGVDGDGDEEDNYEELVGLPSAQAAPKIKSLVERLKEMHGTSAETAQNFRESYAALNPSLVAGAAWRGWDRSTGHIRDLWKQVDIWTSHFREIEGRFGSATASYFRFTRWLLFLNFYTFLVAMLVIVVPFFGATKPSDYDSELTPAVLSANGSKSLQDTVSCSRSYAYAINNVTNDEKLNEQILDIFIGTGWMEKTSMFYGHYFNRTYETDPDHPYTYNMGLAYILAIGVIFLISFFLILINSSHSVKQTVMDNQEQSSVHFSNSVLCGWDYCVFNEKSASIKKRILLQEFKADLLEQIKRLQRQNRSNRQNLHLYFVRLLVNFIVILILAGSLYLVYFTTDRLLSLRDQFEEELLQLLIQILPSLTITIINIVVPEVFDVLVSFEDYWPSFELKITLFRTVLVRLLTLGSLILSLYLSLLQNDEVFECTEENSRGTKCCGNFLWKNTTSGNTIKCWETYVGQQFYKLAIVDFGVLIFLTFCIEFPRKLIYDNFKDKSNLISKYGYQEFHIPRNVLDIVYSQTLGWAGTFFAPLLPAMTLLKVFFIFYMKKWTLMHNYAPPQHAYRVSKSNSFFNIILLISFILVAIIIGYMIGNINPSKSCGPFRLYSNGNYVTWTALTDEISHWPNWASKIFFFFGTTAFFVPCFIVLCFLMYYYWAVGQGYRRKEQIMQEQLKLEAKDKQFLLARVNDIIKSDNLEGVASTDMDQ